MVQSYGSCGRSRDGWLYAQVLPLGYLYKFLKELLVSPVDVKIAFYTK
jgi:hypothetical protein